MAAGEALVATADDLAQSTTGNNNVSFENYAADSAQAFQSNPINNQRCPRGNIITITNGLLQQIAAGRHDLDTANLVAQIAEQQVATH